MHRKLFSILKGALTAPININLHFFAENSVLSEFFSIIVAQVHPVQQWSHVTVDPILFGGKNMYFNKFQGGQIPDKEAISLTRTVFFVNQL